jgi:uncharacterized protein
MSIEESLEEETRKWLAKAEDLFAAVSGEEHFLENISAYIRDSHYFLEKGDLIRAFEAVIWAWAWMEIGLERKILENETLEKAIPESSLVERKSSPRNLQTE